MPSKNPLEIQSKDKQRAPPKTPARQIGANQTIFEVMAAERDKLPDLPQKGKKKGDSSDDDVAIVVDADEGFDLAEMINHHRGTLPGSLDDEGGPLQHGAFIEPGSLGNKNGMESDLNTF